MIWGVGWSKALGVTRGLYLWGFGLRLYYMAFMVLQATDAIPSEYTLSGPIGAKLRQHLHVQLIERGLFLPQPIETKTHAVLCSTKGRAGLCEIWNPKCVGKLYAVAKSRP